MCLSVTIFSFQTKVSLCHSVPLGEAVNGVRQGEGADLWGSGCRSDLRDAGVQIEGYADAIARDILGHRWGEKMLMYGVSCEWVGFLVCFLGVGSDT